MDILVRVFAKRKCFASIDFDTGHGEIKNVYVMSFGDLKKSCTDVEVEFTPPQLRKLRDLLNKMYEDDKFTKKHMGQC